MNQLIENVKKWSGSRRVVSPELSRSQYSLVSCGDLTQGAVQLWMGLPEEVKNDPTLAPFKQLYDEENGKPEIKSQKDKSRKSSRLPFVKSAPLLNNNLIVKDEGGFVESKSTENVEAPSIRKNDLTNNLDGRNNSLKKSLFAKWGQYVKMMSLLAAWLFFTVVFVLYNERDYTVRNTSVRVGETKSFTLPVPASTQHLKIALHLSGPFLTEQYERKLNSSALTSSDTVELWLERTRNGSSQEYSDEAQSSDSWRIIIDNTEVDFNTGESRSSVLSLAPVSNVSSHVYSIRINTTSNETVPFRLSYQVDPLDLNTGVIYAAVLLCILYLIIIFEIINRTMAAIILATVSLAVLALTGQRPSLPELVSWLDAETLLLLFSMMLLVAIMAETGMFDFLAVFTFRVTKGKLWPLISLLCIITASVSTFLDNVTTVLLMTPVIIRLCEEMDLNPVPILISTVLFSNIGGTATPVGDPPTVIISANKQVKAAGINFTNFTLHMGLGIFLVCIQTYFQLRYIYRDTSKLRLNVPRDIQDLRRQITIWRRAAESLPHLSRDEQIVRERLDRKVQKLTLQLQELEKESSKRACPKDVFQRTLSEMTDKYKIRDKKLLIKATFALCFVVTVFFMHSMPELNRISLGWTALLGAILLLILADREDIEPILHKVEWSTLLFFAALFVLTEAISKLGLIKFIGGLTESLILSVDESARLAVALLLMIWVSGLTSAFVDNIPLTTMMVRVMTDIGTNPHLNLPMAPLVWALAFGACLGGNGTLIAASANVVCAGVAGQHGYKITFVEFFKVGFPVMIGHLVVATVYLLVSHCVFTWH